MNCLSFEFFCVALISFFYRHSKITDLIVMSEPGLFKVVWKFPSVIFFFNLCYLFLILYHFDGRMWSEMFLEFIIHSWFLFYGYIKTIYICKYNKTNICLLFLLLIFVVNLLIYIMLWFCQVLGIELKFPTTLVSMAITPISRIFCFIYVSTLFWGT